MAEQELKPIFITPKQHLAILESKARVDQAAAEAQRLQTEHGILLQKIALEHDLDPETHMPGIIQLTETGAMGFVPHSDIKPSAPVNTYPPPLPPPLPEDQEAEA